MKKSEQAEKRKLALVVNLGGFDTLTGEEQMQYIDDLGIRRGAKFIRQNHHLIKADAPAPKHKFLMNKELINFYLRRGFPLEKEMRFVKNIDIRGIDFDGSPIKAEQFFYVYQLHYSSYVYKIPKEVDFKDCNLADKHLAFLDFSDTNITGQQFCQAKYVNQCKLPQGMNFVGCSFEGMGISWVDFSESNITAKQFLQAEYAHGCKLPKGIDFTACSFGHKDISVINFSSSKSK